MATASNSSCVLRTSSSCVIAVPFADMLDGAATRSPNTNRNASSFLTKTSCFYGRDGQAATMLAAPHQQQRNVVFLELRIYQRLELQHGLGRTIDQGGTEALFRIIAGDGVGQSVGEQE